MKKTIAWSKNLLHKNRTHLRPLAFVMAFALIGATALIITKAATPTAAFEAESGTIATGACSVNDTGASGGSAVKFGSCGGGSLPAGVTLQDIDGGRTYYEQWSNSFPSANQADTFYPIGTFNQPLGYNGSNFDSSQIDKYVAAGVNMFVTPYNGYNASMSTYIKNKGAYIISGVPALAGDGKTAPALAWFDEADGNNRCSDIPSVVATACSPTADGRTPANVIATVTQKLHTYDPTRPVYGQYTKPVALGEGLSDAQAAAYTNAVDIVSFDAYVMSDSYESDNHLWNQFDAVAHTRLVSNYNKPVMAFIEAAEPFEPQQTSGVTITPAKIVAEAWQAVIAGARGIEYFDYDYCGCQYPVSASVLIDSRSQFAGIQSAVTTANSQIKALAPVLNAKFAKNYETHTGSLNTSTKYYNNQFYILAGARSTASQNTTFTLAGAPSGTVTVVNENRTIPLNNGTFTDTFAGESAIHIYKVN